MALLELKDVSFGYRGKEVIKDISLSVEEGEFCCIIGPNGTGKTTIFRLISRILIPWQGTIRYRSKDLFSYSRLALASEIATMPQFIDTPFSFSVREFVLMGRFPYLKRFQAPSKYDHEAVERSLSLTDSADLAERKMNELSLGERQRVILAQALAQDPKLLLLDEPTSSLDIGHQAAILDLIKMLNRDRKLTVIMIQHDLNIASLYCQNLILMANGAIFAQGTPKEVLTYQNIENVYKTVVIVKDNPLSHTPHVFMVSKEYLSKPR